MGEGLLDKLNAGWGAQELPQAEDGKRQEEN